jgi:type VI secretion system secreted protein VgrG
MNLQDQVHVDIDGFKPKVIYYDLQVTQTMASHHEFSFLWRYADSVVTDLSDQSKMIRDYSGRDVIFTFKSASGVMVKSKGIIVAIETIDSLGGSAGLIVHGMSHTVYIDDIQKSRTYLDKSLKEIAKKILPEGPGDFYESGDIAPTHSKNIAYTAQYNETNFEYLKRLATRYGQWFYWDGMRLQFGLTKSSKVKLISGSSLHNLKMYSKFMPHKISLSGYDYSNASNIVASLRKTASGSGDGFASHTTQKQHDYFTADTAVSAYTPQASNQQELSEMVKLQTAASNANTIFYSGISYEPLGLGKTFTIINQKIEHSVVAIEVTHLSDDHGNYRCEFKAIPSDVSTPHYTNVHVFAKAENQPAKVIENNDPENNGRVKVSFNWGKGSTESEWVRLLQPHAGSGKGFHFIPEIGEEVLVGFEGSNADKPYILGTHYNGSANSGYSTPNNDMKVIQTRSGTKIIMNDAQGSVLVEDPSGNTWHMDGKGSITVNAPNDITINAGKNINMTAGMNIKTTAGLDMYNKSGGMMHQIAGKDYNLNAVNITKIASEAYNYDAKDILKSASASIETISGGDHKQNSDKTVNNLSGQQGNNA